MAGVNVSGTLFLLLSNAVKHGFYYCKGVTPTGVAGCSSFITLPFPCNVSATPYYCPYGIATDSKLDLYFVADISSTGASAAPTAIRCTAASGYSKCTTLYKFPAHSAPVAITRYNGNLWYANDNCTSGAIWENGILNASFSAPLVPPNSAVTSISWSSAGLSRTPILYVGDSGYWWPMGLYCGFTSFNATVMSVFPFMPQPTPFVGASIIPGLDAALQFTNGGDKAYKTV
jgi:hypothetical protein